MRQRMDNTIMNTHDKADTGANYAMPTTMPTTMPTGAYKVQVLSNAYDLPTTYNLLVLSHASEAV